MNKQEIKKVIQDLNNDIYYEKLGKMVSDLRRWFNDKDKLINQCYIVSFEEIYNKSHLIQEQIEEQTGQLAVLLDEINIFFGFVSKEGFLNKKNSNSKKKTKTQSYTLAIQQVRQVWSKRQANIIQILNISQTINVLISKQNAENRKILNQIKDYGKKIKASPQNSLSQYIKKFEISVRNKNQKQFELNKIKQVYQLFQTESGEYKKNMNKILNLQGKLIDGQAWFIESLKADANNLVFVLNQCFVGFKDTIIKYIQQLMINFKLKIKQVQKSLISLQNFCLTGTTQLKQRLNLIKRQSIQQIQIASWTIYCSLQEKQISFLQKKGVITFDNKFLILQQASSTVEFQINLNQAFLQPVKQLGKLMLKFKGKKKNQMGKIHIKFLRDENEDQFRLHIKKAKGQIQ